MGTGVIIHGYIECPGYAHTTAAKRIYRANRQVILSLPVSDTEWPFLTKDMFSLLPLRPARDRNIAQYENQIIHFAGDYKDMFVLEADWVRKFEALLGQLCWYYAVVLVEAHSLLRYEWEVAFDHIGARYQDDPPRAPSQWSLQCYRLERQAIALAEGIDGPWESEKTP